MIAWSSGLWIVTYLLVHVCDTSKPATQFNPLSPVMHSCVKLLNARKAHWRIYASKAKVCALTVRSTPASGQCLWEFQGKPSSPLSASWLHLRHHSLAEKTNVKLCARLQSFSLREQILRFLRLRTYQSSYLLRPSAPAKTSNHVKAFQHLYLQQRNWCFPVSLLHRPE